jgi:hypothetical protein
MIARKPDKLDWRGVFINTRPKEMGYLAEILPTLYKRYTQDNTF